MMSKGEGGWSGGSRNSTSVAASNGGASIPGFLTKTYEIFSLPEHQEYCGWGPKGDTIMIRKIEPFARLILPKYFKHSNFQSFVRQLNMYDFRKTVQDPGHGEFQHPNFKVNHPELLVLIRRKAHTKSGDSKVAVVVAGGGGGIAKARKGRGGTGQANRNGGRYDGDDDEEEEQEQDQEGGDVVMGQDAAGDDLLLLGSDAELLDMSAGNYAGLQGKGPTPRQATDPTGGSGMATSGSSRFASSLATSYSSSLGAADTQLFSLANSSLRGGPSSSASLRPGPLNRVPLETDAVLKDLVYQKTLRGEFENRLLELEDQQARLVNENKALRDLMVESKVKQDMMQERMNKILRTLYHIFSGSSSSQFQLRAGADGNVALSLRDGGAGSAMSVASGGGGGGGTQGSDANGNSGNNVSANPIQLISALGERNFMDVVGYLELESPLGPRSALGSALPAVGGAGVGAPGGSGGSISFDGAPLCRLPSFETAAARIAPANLVAPSGGGGSRPGPGAPLDRLTSLDWSNYTAATATDVSVPSGQLDRVVVGGKRTLSGGGAEEGGIAAGLGTGAGVAGIAANKRQCLALTLTPAASSSAPSALAIDVAGAGAPGSAEGSTGRPPLPSKSPRTPVSVPASVAKVLAESVHGGKVIGEAIDEEESESIVKLLGRSQVGTISRLNSLELTIQELLGGGEDGGAAE